MKDQWKKIENILKQPIIQLHHPDYKSIYELIEHFWMLPSFRARWCTRILKIEAIQHFYELLKPATIYIGLRADEANRKGNNKLFDPYIEQKYPMQEWGWGIEKVWSYLAKKQITIPRRTDCAMCFFQRLDEWYSLWEEYPEIYKRIEGLEFMVGHSLMTPGKHKNWPSWLFELRCKFEKGKMPQAVKKAKNNKQINLFSDPAPFDYRKCRVCSL